MIKKKFLLPMHKHDYGYEVSFWDIKNQVDFCLKVFLEMDDVSYN